jgi:hypothetical protein
VIIITGCGRSGTSAVARMLHDSGISVGRDLIPADQGNAEGYFEERPVIELNDHIVSAAGLDAWFAAPSREAVLACARPLYDRMRELASGATPAWKDPRFCWTLEAWLPLFEPPLRVIVCLRNPAEVVASTMRYYGVTGDEAWRATAHVWRSENERLLEVVETFALDVACVEYDALHQDPAAAATRIARFLGAPVRASGVRGDLRHHRTAMPYEFAELYELVRRLGT